MKHSFFSPFSNFLKFPHQFLHLFNDSIKSGFQGVLDEVFDSFLYIFLWGTIEDWKPMRILRGLLVPSLQVRCQLPEFPGYVSAVHTAVYTASSGQGFDPGLDVLCHVADEISEGAIFDNLVVYQGW